MEYEKKLAKVSSARLEMIRGILMFYITVDYEDGLSQNVGGLCLDTYDKAKEKRVGTAYGCEMIRRCLLEFNVNDFSEMKGKYIWVLGEGEGFDFTPKGLQKLVVDGGKEKEPFIFSEVFEQFKEGE